MKKVLFCATVDYHFKAFHLPVLKWFKEQGWEVHVAASGVLSLPFVDKKFNIDIQRSPLNKRNFDAYQSLKSILRNEHYNIIHCHTPMGGVLTRLAARSARKKGSRIIYTAHGFHFYKGSPLLNWMIYYPIERWLSSSTDCLITINDEDYRLSTKHKFSAKRIEHVNGVGVDTIRFKPVNHLEKSRLREAAGYQKNDFILFYAAEFNKNKNQQMLIQAIALLKEKMPQVKLLLAGEGLLLEESRELAKRLDILKYIDFLGYRKDIDRILPFCDLAVSSSLREGLPVNIMEAMACGLPVIATVNRGHNELIQHNKSGWLVDHGDIKGMSEKIINLSKNQVIQEHFGKSGQIIVEKKYAINKVLDQNISIYRSYMRGAEDREWAVQ